MGWANYEMAELYWLKGENRKAMEFVKACKKVSSKVKYSLESRVMFKVNYKFFILFLSSQMSNDTAMKFLQQYN